MQFRQTTVLGFFDSTQKSYIIPVYQRAYSWEKGQWDALLEDLKEQIKGNNHYFLGNFLLETIQQDMLYEIIDGQQRLTTLTIFMRAILDIICVRQLNEQIDVDISEKQQIYLKNDNNIKLRPVDYDKACFDSLIIEGNDKFETSTPSQKRIKSAKSYFKSEIDKLSTEDILEILKKIEKTELTSIELEGKKDAALMFELQNNRGKDLTNMERLKSFLMYQMYVFSSINSINTNIGGNFKSLN
ncbi:MAG: hypothetical protein UT30_C0047G0007 [Candidatus Uhrbacteria bacterium GW2011_GWF2_39_13]|uniref:GmrSD restriction endonucleases N-terminal domain-containing protein n=1 Tax=Candidatus Uhrbacteria bacterium GW2011_GWF2_39_13 TaxID=1618995 RepID=A0A0G0QMD8_9BACT|nr:MAG: hypothetical protein UT30_C0047G0007 [Candidatus Uhrbacteria bacterium GW2011_GWF2_39_13]